MPHRTIIVTVDDCHSCRDLCATIAGYWGADMFQCLAGVDGEATHAFSTGIISDEFADMLPLDEYAVNDETETGTYVRQDIGDIEAISAGTGAPESAVSDIFSRSVVTAEDWRTTLARMGLDKL